MAVDPMKCWPHVPDHAAQFFVRPAIFPSREIAEQAAMQAGRHAVDRGYDPSINRVVE